MVFSFNKRKLSNNGVSRRKYECNTILFGAYSKIKFYKLKCVYRCKNVAKSERSCYLFKKRFLFLILHNVWSR